MIEVQAKVTASNTTRSAGPRRVGEWELLDVLGESEWTAVYRARPLGCGHSAGDYVVKLLRSEHADDQLAQEMLQREAFAAGGVRHPRLMTVLASRLQTAPYYLVRPYYAGCSLRERIDSQAPVRLANIVWIARQTAEALAALHAAGYLHGDVKPSNIVVSPEGAATLLDLGLVRRIDDPHDRRAAWMGTPAYAAPETFSDSAPLTQAADLFSLGVVLWEMLSGRRVARDFPLRRSESRAPLHQATPTAPPEVVGLLDRLLAHQPLRRPCAGRLVEELIRLEIETFPLRQW